jgi:hypothetical protein
MAWPDIQIRGTANFHLRTIRLVNPRQWIVMVMTAAVVRLVVAVASPHALVLTVSHGFPVADSCLRQLFAVGSFTQTQAERLN